MCKSYSVTPVQRNAPHFTPPHSRMQTERVTEPGCAEKLCVQDLRCLLELRQNLIAGAADRPGRDFTEGSDGGTELLPGFTAGVRRLTGRSANPVSRARESKSTKPYEKAVLKGKEVVVEVKDIKDLPELKAGDSIFAAVTQVENHLVATKLMKTKAPKAETSAEF
jgi:hypothetical protein